MLVLLAHIVTLLVSEILRSTWHQEAYVCQFQAHEASLRPVTQISTRTSALQPPASLACALLAPPEPILVLEASTRRIQEAQMSGVGLEHSSPSISALSAMSTKSAQPWQSARPRVPRASLEPNTIARKVIFVPSRPSIGSRSPALQEAGTLQLQGPRSPVPVDAQSVQKVSLAPREQDQKQRAPASSLEPSGARGPIVSQATTVQLEPCMTGSSSAQVEPTARAPVLLLLPSARPVQLALTVLLVRLGLNSAPLATIVQQAQMAK